ncbi:hypothetical protein DFP72DRAFT_1075569 [Ephemerocybe angulata]|uniref:Uncharacterized protein n=1 Tax=Ephemerocybe angulata TaxID=980116 RepID=A0A8H6M010_9AGAR|nr:hypothetical protein DFP72DRAFT_1076148 [Tulosesus angulatus]KAF6747321.1 hypothetical protein DFP72DRAFT_1075569 [Tulosesus angulatus]
MPSSLASPTDVRSGSLSSISSSPISIYTSSSASFGRDMDPLLLTAQTGLWTHPVCTATDRLRGTAG